MTYSILAFKAHPAFFDQHWITPRPALGHLLDRSPIHLVEIELCHPVIDPETGARSFIRKYHDMLVAGGRAVMEVDGQSECYVTDILSIHGKPAEESRWYHDYNQLLPFHLRHAKPEHDPVYIDKGESVHLVHATLSELDGREWKHELLIEGGRRITGVDGCPAGAEICGYKVREYVPLEPASSTYYRRPCLHSPLGIAA